MNTRGPQYHRMTDADYNVSPLEIVNVDKVKDVKFRTTVREAQREFKKKEIFHPSNFASTLENEIKKPKESTIKYPPIRDWIPLLAKDDLNQIAKHIIGGLVIGLILIPQCMAYMLMVNLPPSNGVYSCLVSILVYSVFGTSRQLSVGPIATAALMIGASVNQFKNISVAERVELAICECFIMGIFLLIMGLFKLGFIENVYSQPTMSGYLTAASFIICVEQSAKIFAIPTEGTNIFVKLFYIFKNLPQMNVASGIVGFVTFLFLLGSRHLQKNYYPKSLTLASAPLIATIFGILIYFYLLGSIIIHFPGLDDKYNIERATNMEGGFPAPVFPNKMFGDAIKISLVCFSEGLMITKRLAKENEYEVNTSYEFVALGLSNFGSAFFQGFGIFGSMVRSPIYNLAGAKSHVSNLLSGVVVIIIWMFFVDAVKIIPIPLICGFVFFSAAILLMDITNMYTLWKSGMRNDFAMYLSTFVLCLLFSVADGLIISIIISLVWILQKSTKPIWNIKIFVSDPEQHKKKQVDELEKKKNTLNKMKTTRPDHFQSHAVEKKELEEKPRKIQESLALESKVKRTEEHENIMEEARNIFRRSGFFNEPESETRQKKIIRDSLMEEESVLFPGRRNPKLLHFYDLCFCHNTNCKQKCHIIAISLHGDLSYVNISTLKEQIEYIDKMMVIKNEEEKQGYTIRAIVYEFDNVTSIDKTALSVLKDLINDLHKPKKNKRKFFVRFSRMDDDLLQYFKILKYDKDLLEYAQSDTLAAMVKAFKDVCDEEDENLKKEKLNEMKQSKDELTKKMQKLKEKEKNDLEEERKKKEEAEEALKAFKEGN